MTEHSALFLLFRLSPENLARLQRLAVAGDQLLILGAAAIALADQGRVALPPLPGVAISVLGAHWPCGGLEMSSLPPDIDKVDYPAMVRKVESCGVCHSLG